MNNSIENQPSTTKQLLILSKKDKAQSILKFEVLNIAIHYGNRL